MLTILNAYRLGPQVAARPNFPCNVVVHFLYPRSRNAILKCARTGGALKYDGHTIQVLLDLAPDILAKRCTLKSVTETLRGNNVGFHWSLLSDVLVASSLGRMTSARGRICCGRWVFVFLLIWWVIPCLHHTLQNRPDWMSFGPADFSTVSYVTLV